MKKTFYVIGPKAGGYHIADGCRAGSFTSSAATVDGAQQYATLCAAMERWNSNQFEQCSYQIVRVDRVTTPGNTVRRVLKDGELIPANAKWVIQNPYGAHAFYAFGAFADWGAPLARATLFTDVRSLMLQAATDVEQFGPNSNFNVVRVIEETTQETVSDTLTVLA